MKLSAPIQWFFLCVLILFGCATSKTETRPSPLAADSVNINGALIKITYSSPGVKKRKVWGGLVPYGHIWRTGANQATNIVVSKDIRIDGKILPAGSYSIFTIPGSSQWVIIFNKDWDQWGAYNYDESKDALRIIIDPVVTEQYQERMKFTLSNDKLNFHWEYLTFSLPITVD